MKITRSLCTLLFGVAVLLFFGLAYPHHLHYQEQYQLFLFDNTYMWEIVKLPGGVADLLGRFCTQFFLFSWVGAFIIGLLLSAVQFLTYQQVKNRTSQAANTSEGWLYGLSFVPSFLLWLFLLDENALLGGVWAVLLTLLVSWLFDITSKREEKKACMNSSEHEQARPKTKTSKGWMRHILLIVAVPLLYWIVGPVCLLFFLLQAIRPKPSVWHLGVLVLLALMPFILSFYLPVPASSLWFGVHYHRYPTEIPVLLWAASLSIIVLTLIAYVANKREKNQDMPKVKASRHHVVTLCSFVLVAIGMGCLVWESSNFKAEKVMQYDFMARYQQWNRILATISAEKPNNQIGVTVQNLALAMHGQLADHLFDYNQNGISGLLPDVERDATSPLPTAEAFYQLGMINVAQRSVFEAQEAILDFQKSARCYKRLAETNLINGNYEVARKYLKTLQKTLFYREWANETLPLLGDEKAIAKHPEYGHLRQMAYNDNFFFSDHTTAEMLESLFFSNTDNRLAYEYLKAYYMLTGDRDSYAKLLLHLQKQ